MTMSGKRKPGRPPTKRPTDPINGTPIAMASGSKPPETPSINGTARASSSGVVTPSGRSLSPPVSSGSVSIADDAPALSELPHAAARAPVQSQYIFPPKQPLPRPRSRLGTSVAGEPEREHALSESMDVDATPNAIAEGRAQNGEPKPGPGHTSAAPGDASRIRELPVDPAFEARKRKASNDTYPQPSPKAAKVVPDSPKEGSAFHVETRPPVVTPRIEALVAPTSSPS